MLCGCDRACPGNGLELVQIDEAVVVLVKLSDCPVDGLRRGGARDDVIGQLTFVWPRLDASLRALTDGRLDLL